MCSCSEVLWEFLLGIVFIFCAWLTGPAERLIFWPQEQRWDFMDTQFNEWNYLLLDFSGGKCWWLGLKGFEADWIAPLGPTCHPFKWMVNAAVPFSLFFCLSVDFFYHAHLFSERWRSELFEFLSFSSCDMCFLANTVGHSTHTFVNLTLRGHSLT